jgi:penicillin V acylase-like amidase (Ntn superfamily)
MRRILVFTFLIVFLVPGFIQGQISADCDKLKLEASTDIMIFDKFATSYMTWPADLFKDAKLVACPAGIERSSPDDIKKRFSFDWIVKYKNIYIELAGGLVVDGINDHGFSASLMYLNNSQLPVKDKEHIPIAASLCINFFIDHFTNIDTALLAVWDIRIFDDMGLDCGWPFRLVLHDSSGATVYVEHIEGQQRVYTPEAPAVITDGSEYARMLMLKHLQDSLPKSKAERRFLDFEQGIISFSEDNTKRLIQYYKDNYPDIGNLFIIWRSHVDAAMIIRDSSKLDIFETSEMKFTPGEETFQKIF